MERQVSRMKYKKFWKEVQHYQKPTRRLVLKTADIDQMSLTRIGGAPWWPKGKARPRCIKGHLMSFMAQIGLGDVPGIPQPDEALLSFHYCQECTYEGSMAWGLSDIEDTINGYDLTIFEDWRSVESDGLGIVAEDVLGPHGVSFSDREETPSLEDIWEIDKLSSLLPRGGGDDDDDELNCIFSDASSFDEAQFPSFIHIPTSKLGGWPSWCQTAKWPEHEGRHLIFVAQIDYVLGENASWGGGGYAYLFLASEANTKRSAAFLIQTT